MIHLVGVPGRVHLVTFQLIFFIYCLHLNERQVYKRVPAALVKQPAEHGGFGPCASYKLLEEHSGGGDKEIQKPKEYFCLGSFTFYSFLSWL